MGVSFGCGGIVDVSGALLVGHTCTPTTAAVTASCPSSSDASLSLRSGVLLFGGRQEVSTGRVRALSKMMVLAGGPLTTLPPSALFLFLSVPFLRDGRRIFMAGIVVLRSTAFEFEIRR